jgi:hypothetical protein
MSGLVELARFLWQPAAAKRERLRPSAAKVFKLSVIVSFSSNVGADDA